MNSVKIFSWLALAMISMLHSVHARPILMDFEDVASGTFYDSFYVDGFQISRRGGAGIVSIAVNQYSYWNGHWQWSGNGTKRLLSFAADIILSSMDDSPFSLLGFDVSETWISTWGSDSAREIEIVGEGSNGLVTESFELDHFEDPEEGFQTLELNGFNDLTKVAFMGRCDDDIPYCSRNFSLDNIQLEVNQVPLPPTLWLIGLGLVVLRGIRFCRSGD